VPTSLQRPFVPHRTPNTGLPAMSASEFRLYRPFVPGAERASIAAFQAEIRSEPRVESAASLRPIEEYLNLSPPTAGGVALESNGDELSSSLDEVPDELPPVEHFLDPLPRVEGVAPLRPQTFEGTRTGQRDIPESGPPSDTLASEWADTDWQHYDWRAAAGLRESGDSAATNAWATTNWDASAARAKDELPTAAQAIASALDQIAQRIRAGELGPMPGAAADPATIAATFAALLGIRR
jgi:hypothetical protein